MRVISRRTLREYWERHAGARLPLQDWYATISGADWATPADLKAQHPDASILAGNRVVFNVAGNRLRIVVRINYPYRVIYIRFVGSHQDYDQIDATII